MTKTYELPNGRKMSADFDENGIGKITVQALDSLVNELNEYASEECDRDCEHCAYLECPIEPCEDAVHLTKEAYSQLCLEASKWNELKECEDAVSRADVIDQLHQSINLLEAEDRINDLPSVQPKAKTGVWMRVLTVSPKVFCNRCSECGYEQFYAERYNFCPYCGAGMRGEEE